MSTGPGGWCLTCGKQVGEAPNNHVCEYTTDMLSAAFDLVKPKNNWKFPIDAVVSADADQDLIIQAVIFYTGSLAEFIPNADGSFNVYAEGYYAAIGS